MEQQPGSADELHTDISGNIQGSSNVVGSKGVNLSTGARRQVNEITNNFEAPERDDRRMAALEQRVSTLESMLTIRFLIADGQREDLRDAISEVRDEVRSKPAVVAPVTWHFWVSIVLAAVVAVTMWIFIMRLDTVIERLPAPVEQRQK